MFPHKLITIHFGSLPERGHRPEQPAKSNLYNKKADDSLATNAEFKQRNVSPLPSHYNKNKRLLGCQNLSCITKKRAADTPKRRKSLNNWEYSCLTTIILVPNKE